MAEQSPIHPPSRYPTPTQAAALDTMTVVQRRAHIRQHHLDRLLALARETAARELRSTNCYQRVNVYGPDHEPCKAPPDVARGVWCLCECHDELLKRKEAR